MGILRRAGYEGDPLDSGCCSMVGSFGYEEEHDDLSKLSGESSSGRSTGATAIRWSRLMPKQLRDRKGGTTPPHPVELLAHALSA